MEVFPGCAQSKSYFDNRGRVYQSAVFAVGSGTPGNALTTNNWYDESGNLIKSIGGGAGTVFRKTVYMAIGWMAASYRGYSTTTDDYTTATNLTYDLIMSQSENTYDEAGNVILQKMYQRLNDASTSDLGALTTSNARVSYAASWVDGIDRAYAAANYGAPGSAPTRGTTPPSASDTVLVTSTIFDDAGRVYQSTDPKGLVSQRTYDNAGRTTQTIGNVGGLAQTTNYTYTLDSQTLTLVAVNGTTGDQTTTYTYGTTLSDSGVASNSLLVEVEYPDTGTVALTYNRLGQMATRTDQRGTVRTFVYDKLGRPTDDCVTTNGTGTDVTVKRISSTYEVRGMIETLTSYDNKTPGSGTALDQVELTYNDFGQLIEEDQEHSGTVSSSPSVQYDYDDGSSDSNQIRPITLTYPNARQIDYDYSGGSGLDDNLNRVSAIINDSGPVTLASYTYLGAGTVIRIDYNQASVRLDLWGGTSGTFAGVDLFGRIIDQRWVTTGGSPTDRDRYKYGYDRNSNRFYKQNTVGSTLDEFYTYDNLNRLTVMKRGTLTGGPPFTGISGTPVREMDYTLDPTGNWSAYLTKTTGTTDLNQSRTHTTVNEISNVTESTGPTWIVPAYDAAGNTTTVPSGLDPTVSYTNVYDAWNRLMSVTNTTSTHLVAEYQYDGRGRRIVKKTYNSSGTLTETRDFYWSNAWQDLEERVGGSMDTQQVWGIRYVDELICRDDNTRRLYACQDANFNVTALLDTSGVVQQRFVYDPYGQSSVRDKTTWAVTTDAYAWQWRHQGLCEDQETGLVYNRARYLHALLGRFLQRDTLEHANGNNAYEQVDGNPGNFVDPNGTNALPNWNAEPVDAEEAQRRADYFYDSWQNKNGRPHENNAQREFEWWSKKAVELRKGNGGKWVTDYAAPRVTCEICQKFGPEVAQQNCIKQIALIGAKYGAGGAAYSLLLGGLGATTGLVGTGIVVWSLTAEGAAAITALSVGWVPVVGWTLLVAGLAYAAYEGYEAAEAMEKGDKAVEATKLFCDCNNARETKY